MAGPSSCHSTQKVCRYTESIARPGRIEYEDAFCHVMYREDCKEAIFIDCQDLLKFHNTIENMESRYNLLFSAIII